ncbi:hypothetical protein ACQ4M4_21765 [Leptolyngbya sp. AN02str]|uniref:hypothetical protein n=1 Tax=Leptolyngbya sp. AN02str TaxID=3423363 RepID=UPI003D324409
MMSVLNVDLLDRRVLGAISLIDNVTEQPISHPLQIELVDSEETVSRTTALHLRRNPSGYYVILSVVKLANHTIASAQPPTQPDIERLNQLANHTTAFAQPPAQPDIESLTLPLRIQDQTGQYLPRRYDLKLPRQAPLVVNGEVVTPLLDNSLLRPILVPLCRAPRAPIGPNWAVLRVTLTEQRTVNDEIVLFRLPWALIRVSRAEPPVLSMTSWSDWRGEALIAMPGIPVLISSSGATDDDAMNGNDTTHDNDVTNGDVDEQPSQRAVSATVQVYVDPALGPTPPAPLPMMPQFKLETDFSQVPVEDLRSLWNYLPHPPTSFTNPPASYVAAQPLTQELIAGRTLSKILTVSFQRD